MSYENYPTSLNARRAQNSNDGSHWTPRDILIQTLREIDAGDIAPNTMVIAWSSPINDKQDASRPGFRIAAKTLIDAVGVLGRAVFMMQQGR